MICFSCEPPTIMIWTFPTAPKRGPVHIIRFTPTTLKNGQHPCKRVRVDEYDASEKSTDATNLIVDELEYPKKLLLVMHHGSMETIKYTT